MIRFVEVALTAWYRRPVQLGFGNDNLAAFRVVDWTIERLVH